MSTRGDLEEDEYPISGVPIEPPTRLNPEYFQDGKPTRKLLDLSKQVIETFRLKVPEKHIVAYFMGGSQTAGNWGENSDIDFMLSIEQVFLDTIDRLSLIDFVSRRIDGKGIHDLAKAHQQDPSLRKGFADTGISCYVPTGVVYNFYANRWERFKDDSYRV